MGVSIKFSAGEAKSDPADVPVIVIGQLKNLQRLQFSSRIRSKMEPRVSEEAWKTALASLNPTPTDTISLYLNLAYIAALPGKCSRHNAPSRGHAVTKLVKSFSSGQSEHIVIVCDRSDVYASGCAVARAYPTYSRKTSEASRSNLVIDDAKETAAPASKESTVNVEFLCPNGDAIEQTDLEALEHAAFGIRLAAEIVDKPCNEMHTDAFLDVIRDVGSKLGLTAEVIQGESLKERGFGGIYGVGKAAAHAPALAVLSHLPKDATETVAWVGKGIVYDTGGLSIKGKTAMPGMKRDCGGAAAILGAFYAAVRQNFSQNLHAVFCLAENAVSERATRPDDIHTLYSGRTVEINNTDAEGRLVVSDGVAYARKDLGADIIVDMCTLTGAQGIATGRYHAAHLTNTEEWESYCSEAGRASSDLSFPLVYCPEMHFPEFSSAVADMKNSVADRNNAQASCAGLFINAHLGFDYPGVWLHVDMAAPVHMGERATGFGVALLTTLFGRHTNAALLKESCPVPSTLTTNGADPSESKSKRMRKK